MEILKGFFWWLFRSLSFILSNYLHKISKSVDLPLFPLNSSFGEVTENGQWYQFCLRFSISEWTICGNNRSVQQIARRSGISPIFVIWLVAYLKINKLYLICHLRLPASIWIFIKWPTYQYSVDTECFYILLRLPTIFLSGRFVEVDNLF